MNTSRLHLEPVSARHLPFLWQLHSDERTFTYDSTRHLETVDQMQAVLAAWELAAEKFGSSYQTVFLADHTPIGVAGFKGIHLNQELVLNLYVRFTPEYWGHGFAREALLALMAEIDQKFPGQRAIILTDEANQPMRKLAGYLGFYLTEEQDSSVNAPHVIYARTCGAGRYAPSPSGDLHLGNLRTALLAWLFARSEHRKFKIRVEDLDRVKAGAAERQLGDLEKLGLDWDGEVLFQSTRQTAYHEAIAQLVADDLVYECYCTRAEILAAPSAPHAPPGAYPGTCAHLNAAQRKQGRMRMQELKRKPALRLRAQVHEYQVFDRLHGWTNAQVDDTVLTRGDGVVAYNLAVVVDDAFQKVGQIVRGDDLLSSAPRQAWIAHELHLNQFEYAHVPLVLGEKGARLAKRDGAVTLRERLAQGENVHQVVRLLAASLGYPEIDHVKDLVDIFDPTKLPRQAWQLNSSTSNKATVEEH